MALLNKKLDIGFKFLHSQRPGITNTPNVIREEIGSLIWLLRTWDDKDYFYCEIFQGNAFEVFPVDTVVPADILEKIRTDDRTYFYVCNTHESFLDIVEPLYQSLVIEAGIPPKKIYISNEAPDLHLAVRKYADENNLEYMNVEWILEFEYSISWQANDLKLDGSTILQNKNYDKKFLNFNRRWRLHRPTFVALLKATGLLDKGYVSLAPSDDGRNWNDMWQWIKDHHKNDEEITKLLLDNEQEIINMPSLYLDTDELVNNRAIFEKESLYLYENSLVSVVNETTFYHGYHPNESRFLSEKIFKPISVGHPFIFVTVPKALEVLKTLGYRTFHPYIDESYDLEFDNGTRMKMILKEIERICNFTEEETKEFLKNVKPLCDYNQELLKSKTLPFVTGKDPGCHILHSHFVRKML
jgi:hypothetical protein